ncbi:MULTISPECIES: hypothetical protein [unclassified Streptomyces]|uniref:hypothetical protein n=1 Tax=unclassified Streptomyces TaxID=2593676 RepID=UPI00165528C1|nr:hypothetical protein [Streptomyces sp. CB02980]MCB8902408.1 S1 family peptidase [Streptomyces sp. CB02980]
MPRINEPPPDDFAQSGEAVEIPQPEVTSDHIGFDPDQFPTELVDARAALEGVLSGQGEQRGGLRSAEHLTELTNVQGVGIGRATPSEYGPRSRVIEPGQPTLSVYLSQPRTADDVEALIVEEMGVRVAASSRVPIVPVVTGEIATQMFTLHRRPASGGTSISSPVSPPSAGTLGCLATGRSFPRDLRTLAISCNHVIADVNAGALGNCIAQPGRADAGVCPQHLIGVLERFTRIEFGGVINSVDCATAWVDPAQVNSNILINGVLGPVEVPISTMTGAATLGMLVFKSGRTTEVTTGTVKEIGASHWVNQGGQNAFFAGSLAIEGTGTFGPLPFSKKGDSGAIAWTFDLVRTPIGLVYSSSSTVSIRSFANPIDIVTQSLDVFII